MKKILLTLVVLTTLLISTSYAQMPWQYTVTGLNHTVLVQASTSITINGTALTSGDYIGMFYDSLGTLACGGYLEYTGGTGAAAAWANDANSTDIDGFANNEEFKWKIWRASDGMVFNAVATYITTGLPNQGNFSVNGMSGLATLTAIVGSDVAVGNITSPASSCGDLTAAEMFSFQVLNLGVTAVDSVMVSYSVDAGTTVFYDTIVQNIPVGGTYNYTASQTFDFSAIGSYSCIITVENSLDDTPGNDTLSYSINNFSPAPVSMIGFDTAYCTSNVPLQLVSSHPGGIYMITPGTIPVILDQIYFTIPGSYELNYSYTDSNNCVTTVVEPFTVNQSPLIELGANVESCEGGVEELSVAPGYISYSWSTASTDTLISVTTSGIYSVSVTGVYGCVTVDSVEVTFNPSPVVAIQGDTVGCDGETVVLDVIGQGSSYAWSTGSFLNEITVNASGVYSVTVSEQGCTGFDVVEVNFYANPVLDLGADIESCEGDTVVLDAGPYTSFLWSNGSTSQTIDVTYNGAFGVAITDEHGCIGGDNIAVTFQLLAVADFTYDVSGTVVTFTNASANADTYLWDFGNSTTSTNENPVVDYGAYDTYTIELAASNDCGTDMYTADITILGVNDIALENDVQLWPNPSTGAVNLLLGDAFLNDATISVYNSLGEIVHVIEATNRMAVLDITSQPTGIYFVQVNTNARTIVKKLIRQ